MLTLIKGEKPCTPGHDAPPTQHYKPFGLLHTVGIVLGVAKGGNVDLVSLGNFALGSVSDEDGLATPLDDDLEKGEKEPCQ